jgi:glycosyltransferase involved in cell wall biosynthesis
LLPGIRILDLGISRESWTEQNINMTHIFPDSSDLHASFLASPRKHVLMITNHGIHQWDVIPGLPDTGGQNVFVNQFTTALAKCGFKITIVNRGGYKHPVTGDSQTGLLYKDQNQRILYLQDDLQEFVRKEDMHEQIPELVYSLEEYLNAEGTKVDLIISHYWDAAEIGVLYNKKLPEPVLHAWVPHSLGALKKRNVSSERWADLRIDERILAEMALIPHLDGIAATSSAVKNTLKDDYGYTGPDLFLPPCVEVERFHPRQVADDDSIWDFLSQHSGLAPEEVRSCKIVCEISRTDTTKRKDVLIKAFADVYHRCPDCLLVVSIDDKEKALSLELRNLIRDCGAEKNTAVVGSIWDLLPTLYAVTDVYCTPSVMEGFGMSAQEAAATRVPIVASNLVPFVDEYLLGESIEEIWFDDNAPNPIRKGYGAIVVQADDVPGFAFALETLLFNDTLRRQMGENAYNATIPYFTWDNMVKVFLEVLGIGN